MPDHGRHITLDHALHTVTDNQDPCISAPSLVGRLLAHSEASDDMTRFTEASTTNRDEEHPSKKRKTTGNIATTRHHTRDSQTAPREAVFNTPELLETMIVYLPPRDILTTVQRVSQQWKATVSSSPTIKAKLGIRSQGVTACTPSRFADEQIFNFSTVRGWPESCYVEMAYPMYLCDLTLNSRIHGKRLHGLHVEWEEGGCVRDLSGISWSLLTLLFGIHSMEECETPSFGSFRTWREMYLTQPPITTGILELCLAFDDGEHRLPTPDTICVAVRDHNGLTLGLLHDTMIAALESEFRDFQAYDSEKLFLGSFRFASTCENLSQQCLQSISEQKL